MELAIEKTKFSKMDRKTLIHNIRLLRVAKNLKAHELSTLLNLDYNRITTIETNYKTRIDPQEVKIIADHFKVTPEILMTVEGSITFKTQQDGKEDTSES
jgi:transcriptional regulator with XRE-family HTH domain